MNYKFLVVFFVSAYFGMAGCARAMNNNDSLVKLLLVDDNQESNGNQELQKKYEKVAWLFSCIDIFYQRAFNVVDGQNLNIKNVSLADLSTFRKEIGILMGTVTEAHKAATALHAECRDVINSDSVKPTWDHHMKQMHEVNEKLCVQFFNIEKYCWCSKQRAKFSANTKEICDKVEAFIAMLNSKDFTNVSLQSLTFYLSEIKIADKSIQDVGTLGFNFSKNNLSSLKNEDLSQLEFDAKKIKKAHEALLCFCNKLDNEKMCRENYAFEALPYIRGTEDLMKSLYPQ